MLDFDGTVSQVDLSINLPTQAEWLKLGLGEAKEIRQRAESRGQDVNNQSFKPYTQAYAEYRASKGRGKKPNLSFTGRMMGAIGSNVRANKDSVTLTLSGEEGLKAWANEQNGRVFFGVTDDRVKYLAENFADLIFKRI